MLVNPCSHLSRRTSHMRLYLVNHISHIFNSLSNTWYLTICNLTHSRLQRKCRIASKHYISWAILCTCTRRCIKRKFSSWKKVIPICLARGNQTAQNLLNQPMHPFCLDIRLWVVCTTHLLFASH